MIITRTTPVDNYYDSYIVEVKAQTFKGASESYINLGPFKRVPHQANLENLLETLQSISEQRDNTDNYWSVFGFAQWFDETTTNFEELKGTGGWNCSVTEDFPREDHEKAFTLSDGFSQNWNPEEGDEGYMHKFVSYKVYYYDYNGIKYNTEVTL
jgi:hypothetical protein